MINKCVNWKVRSTKGIKYFYCVKFKMKVHFKCKCSSLEYKFYKKMKKRTVKQNKLEKGRFSIICSYLPKCYLCGIKGRDHMHEIYGGRNRQNSMKYGLCIPVCASCHSLYQNDSNFNECWHKQGQIAFNREYPELDFKKIFKINYLD